MPLFHVKVTAEMVVYAPNETLGQAEAIERLKEVDGLTVESRPLTNASDLPPGWIPNDNPFGDDETTIAGHLKKNL